MTRFSFFFVSTIFLSMAPAVNAGSQYVKIGPGPSLDYAKAYCSNASMGVGYGYWAYGSQSYVLGAALGNAIGNALMQAQYYSNCMTMRGWKKMRVKTGQLPPQEYRQIRRKSTLSAKCRKARSMDEMLAHC